jgi:hypothetical protein
LDAVEKQVGLVRGGGMLEPGENATDFGIGGTWPSRGAAFGMAGGLEAVMHNRHMECRGPDHPRAALRAGSKRGAWTRRDDMNLEKFTDRARGFLQAAQTIAQREDHQKLMPEHLLKALLDDDQGMAASLIGRAGGAPERVRERLDAALAKMPKVTGDAGQLYLDGQTAKVMGEAEKLAQKAGDSFVAVERILTALAMVKSGARTRSMQVR